MKGAEKALLGVSIAAVFAWLSRPRAALAQPGGGQVPRQTYYQPSSPAAVALFTEAARQAGLPVAWGADPGLHAILGRESGGWVGRPNYHFGPIAQTSRAAEWPAVWAAIRDGSWRTILAEPYRSGPRAQQSSASGLGQLTSTNILTGRFYPAKLAGIGDPVQEAIGMLKYIAERYGTPANAWARYGKGQEGY